MQNFSERDGIALDTPAQPPIRPRPPGIPYDPRVSEYFPQQRVAPSFTCGPIAHRSRLIPSHLAQAAATATMAAAVDQYSFHTPGIDQALISAGEYPFGPSVPGSEFVDKSWSTMDESSLPENFGFDPPNTELEQGQRFSMMDFQHPDPLPASLTPPELAAEYEAYRPPQPQPIDTSHSFEHTRFQHGQVTPPDDEFPPDAKFPLVDQVVDMPIKQEAADPLPIASLPKRKRSSGSDESQSGPKRRRSRKAIVPPMPEDESLEPVEDEKRNKFLERNRVAASKCRQKKKEWTQNLESQARELQAAKTQMSILVTSLKDEVMWLKGEMLKHTDCGCHHIREYLSREAESIALGGGRTPPVHSPIERPSSTSHSSPDDNSGESVASWTGDECMNFSGPGTGAPGAPITTGVQSDKGDMSPTGRIGVNKSISSSGT